MTPRPTSGRRDDEGTALILAMIFVTTVSLVVGALLSYSSTGLRSARTTQTAAQTTANVVGALQTAINDVRGSSYFNNPASPTTCLPGGSSRAYPAASDPVNPAADITVTCAPDATSGAAGGLVHVNDSNKPSLAVLTLGGVGEVGLDKTGNRPLKIKGSVYATTTINANGGTACPATWPPPSNSTNCNGVFTQGPDASPDNVSLTADGGCNGTIVTRLASNRHCPATHSSQIGDDPAITYPSAYAQPTAGMTPQPLPTCAGNPVTFTPGYYDDAVGLSNLMGGSGTCGGKTFWFSPGIYYFDFHNSAMPTSGSPVIPNGSDVWTFNDAAGVLVGGTKLGWTTSTTKANMPGSCVSPLTSEASAGVQFVFGGDSQFSLGKGSMEVCGTWYVDRPSLVFYGAKSTTGSALQGPVSVAPTALTSPGSPAFSPLIASQLASATDGGLGPRVSAMAKNKSADLNVAGWGGLGGAIGTRASLEQAIVTVRHGELGANSGTTLVLKLTPNRAGAPTITKPLTVTTGTSSLAYRTETLNVTDDLRSELYAYGITNPSVPVTATVGIATDSANGQSVSEQVDYLNLSLSWRAVAFRAEQGCITQVPGCALLTTSNLTDELYLQGTSYAPKARLDIRLVGVTGQVFRAGLVARSAALNVSPSNGYEGPLIELPDNAYAPTPLKVYLTAWSCPGGGCSTPPSTANGWTVRGRTVVQYTDAGFVPVGGQRGVTVQSWFVAR